MTRYCDCFLPRKHCKIENRRNHGPNLKLFNRREKSIDASGDVLFKKYWKYADYANSATFTIKEKLCSFFQINCAKNYASTISKGRPENPLILYPYGKCYRAGIWHRTKSHVSVFLKRGGNMQLHVSVMFT